MQKLCRPNPKPIGEEKVALQAWPSSQTSATSLLLFEFSNFAKELRKRTSKTEQFVLDLPNVETVLVLKLLLKQQELQAVTLVLDSGLYRMSPSVLSF